MFWNKTVRMILMGVFLVAGVPLVGKHLDTSSKKFKELMGNSKYAKGRSWNLRSRDKAELDRFAKIFSADIKFLKQDALYHIPHIAHVIWVGPNQFPSDSVENMRSFQKLHPDWTFFFWTDNPDRPTPIPEMKKRVMTDEYFAPVLDMLRSSTNYGEQSDLMRFVILDKEGGVYFDHDASFVRSLNTLADHYDLVTAFERIQYHVGIDTFVTPAIGLILSRPHHPVFQKCIAMTRARWAAGATKYPDPKDWRRVIYRTYDSFAHQCKATHNQDGNRDLILPPAYFYPNMAFKEPFVKRLLRQGYVYAFHDRQLSWREKSGR